MHSNGVSDQPYEVLARSLGMPTRKCSARAGPVGGDVAHRSRHNCRTAQRHVTQHRTVMINVNPEPSGHGTPDAGFQQIGRTQTPSDVM